MEISESVKFMIEHFDELTLDKLSARVENILKLVSCIDEEDSPIEDRVQSLKALLLNSPSLHYDVENFREFFDADRESKLTVHECNFDKNEPIITFGLGLNTREMITSIGFDYYFKIKICGEDILFSLEELETAKKVVSGEYKNFLDFCVTSKKYEQLREFKDKLGRLCALYGIYIGDIAEMCWTTDDELKTVEYNYTERKGSPCIEVVEVVEKDGTQIL